MDVMDQVWKHCIEVVSDFSAVFVALKTLKKQLHKCVSLETILTNQESHTYVFIRLVDKAMDSFGVSSLSFSESMWKMRSLGSLRSLPLFRILEEFKDLDSKSRLCANSLLGKKSVKKSKKWNQSSNLSHIIPP